MVCNLEQESTHEQVFYVFDKLKKLMSEPLNKHMELAPMLVEDTTRLELQNSAPFLQVKDCLLSLSRR